MGGLIARTYIQQFGGDRRVKSLITLGTPHHGTPTAILGVGLMGGGLLSVSPLQMLPRSRLLKRMHETHFPAHIPLTSIFSRQDLGLSMVGLSARSTPRQWTHSKLPSEQSRPLRVDLELSGLSAGPSIHQTQSRTL